MTNNDCCLELEIELATIVDCRPCVDRRGVTTHRYLYAILSKFLLIIYFLCSPKLIFRTVGPALST